MIRWDSAPGHGERELVDPAQCRMWEGHNRDYQALDETARADLIASFKAQWRREVAAGALVLIGRTAHASADLLFADPVEVGFRRKRLPSERNRRV
jgi:hypothetical protein